MSTKPLPNPSPCHPVTPSPCHVVRPRTAPILTGRVLLAAGALLTLTACKTSGVQADSARILAERDVLPTQPAPALPPTQKNPERTLIFRTTGAMAAPTTQWSTTQPAPTYTVKKGDTLTAIARAHNTTVAALKKANPTLNPDVLPIGYQLNLP